MNALKQSLLALAIAGTFVAGTANAQISDNVIKIGVLSDMSSLYTDLAGAGSVAAARMAVEDSGIEKRGIKSLDPLFATINKVKDGKSLQAAPVRNFHKTPSRTSADVQAWRPAAASSPRSRRWPSRRRSSRCCRTVSSM